MVSLPSAFSCKVKALRTTSDSFLYFLAIPMFCKQWLGFPSSLELIVSPQGQLETGHGGELVVTRFPAHHCLRAFRKFLQRHGLPQDLKICTNVKMSIYPLFRVSLL